MGHPFACVVGVDFGTDSVRAVLADACNGAVYASATVVYPRWRTGRYCDAANAVFRQHPLDYLESLEAVLHLCGSQAGDHCIKAVRALSMATTGSTPAPVDNTGTPLAMQPRFADAPNAQFWLWKDHSALAEAEEINGHATRYSTDYLQYAGGIYSAEWYWAKLLHLLRTDPALRHAAAGWVELCDWLPFALCGGSNLIHLKRSTCAAGHKALWCAQWGGLPPPAFFTELDPVLAPFCNGSFQQVQTAEKPVGKLSDYWAGRLGLPAGIQIGGGAFDCHMGAVGAQIEAGTLLKVMGTSTCDMMVAPADTVRDPIAGICGQVPGSIVPGMLGLEAGQSAFGDLFAWLRNLLAWPLRHCMSANASLDPVQMQALTDPAVDQILPLLSEAAAALPPAEAREYAVDWINGRRSPDADQSVTGIIGGLHLGTGAPQLFRALAEAACFGAKAIADRFQFAGIAIDTVTGTGGIAHKAPFLMQLMADVFDRPIRIHRAEEACAHGAAMFAATAAGLHPNVEAAMKHMGQGFSATYLPTPEQVPVYRRRYRQYEQAGAFIQNGAGQPVVPIKLTDA